MKNNKKAQIGGAVGSIIQLVTGIGVAVMVLIFVGALGGQTYNLVEPDIDEIGREAVTNYLLPTVTTGTPITIKPLMYSGTFSLLNGSTSVGTGNYTIVDYDAGTFNLTTVTYNQSTTLYASFAYQNTSVKDSVKTGIISGFDALKQTGEYLPIIVLAIVIALVLFLVLGMTNTANGGNKGGGTAL